MEGRIDELLVKHREENRESFELLNERLKQMPFEQKEAVEQYMEAWNQWNMKELLYVYKAAFLDGLRLGHEAFE